MSLKSSCCNAKIIKKRNWKKTGWPLLDYERKEKWRYMCLECKMPTEPIEPIEGDKGVPK